MTSSCGSLTKRVGDRARRGARDGGVLVLARMIRVVGSCERSCPARARVRPHVIGLIDQWRPAMRDLASPARPPTPSGGACCGASRLFVRPSTRSAGSASSSLVEAEERLDLISPGGASSSRSSSDEEVGEILRGSRVGFARRAPSSSGSSVSGTSARITARSACATSWPGIVPMREWPRARPAGDTDVVRIVEARGGGVKIGMRRRRIVRLLRGRVVLRGPAAAAPGRSRSREAAWRSGWRTRSRYLGVDVLPGASFVTSATSSSSLTSRRRRRRR